MVSLFIYYGLESVSRAFRFSHISFFNLVGEISMEILESSYYYSVFLDYFTEIELL